MKTNHQTMTIKNLAKIVADSVNEIQPSKLATAFRTFINHLPTIHVYYGEEVKIVYPEDIYELAQELEKLDSPMTKIVLTEQAKESILNAIDYTLATIYPNCRPESRPEWIEIHRGRAFQSKVFLQHARQILTESNETISSQ